MHLRYLPIIFFIILSSPAWGQPQPPKDIAKVRLMLAKSHADTSKVKLMVDMARYYNSINSNAQLMADSALIFASRANQLAAKSDYEEGLGLSYQVIAQAWCKKRDFKKSDELIRKAISIFLAHNLYADAAEAYLNMEEFYLSAGCRDYKVMIGYYEQALPLFEKSGARVRAAATLTELGDFYSELDDLNRSIGCLNRALAYYQTLHRRDLQRIYDLLGSDYLEMNNFREGFKYAFMAVKTGEELRDSTMMMCAVYNHAGILFYSSCQYIEADYYYKKAILIAEKYHDEADIFLSSNIANCFNSEKKPSEAIKALKHCERLFSVSNSKWRYFYDAVYLISYTRMRQYDAAKVYSDRLMKVFNKQLEGGSVEINVFGSLIEYLNSRGRFEEARVYMEKYEKDIKTSSYKKWSILNFYHYSFQIDSGQRKYYSAIKNYRKFTLLKDSISEDAKNKQVQELQVKYETEKKEKELIFLKKDSLLQHDKVKQADYIRNLTLIGTLILTVLISLLFYSFRVNQKSNRKITEKNVSLNRLITEKEWLLKEIHHRVKNNLQIVMGLLQRQSAYINNNEALVAIQNSENRMHAIALIHQKLYQSENLDLICMPEYIDEMVSYLKESCGLGSRILFEKYIDEIYLDVAQAVPLGLIMNEAITNAIKYAYPEDESGIIYIWLIKKDQFSNQLVIKDDGPGFPDTFDIRKVDSLGINLMRGLSKQLNGNFEIDGNGGCTVRITFKTEIFTREHEEAEFNLT